ncbi:MAG: hypothetical protein ABI675_13085 [Chitinophagaceae bacterium]
MVVWLFSCNSIKPVTLNNLLQTLSSGEIAKLDGEYEIISSDTSYPTLARALTFAGKKYLNSFNHLDQLAKRDIRLKIKSIDDRHLRITVYSRDKVIKTKEIKGRLAENYFHFKLTKISSVFPFYLILNLYKRQENRIGLTKSGDLLLDSYEGGVLLLIFIPTFGGDTGSYNLIFKKK